MQFKLWLENLDSKRDGVKGTILNFLKDKLNLDSDEAILSLPLNSIGKEVLGDLMARGLVNTGDDTVLQSIKNGNGSVAELIDRVAGMAPQINAPVGLSNEGAPAGWAPSPRMAVSPFASALHKIARNSGNMPFSGNFTDPGVFQIRFGLDREELDLLKTYGYLVKSPYGWNIDEPKFKKMYAHQMDTIRELKARRLGS